MFFATPLLYLYFHLHPIFADLPVLLAHLLPHLGASALAASVLVPGWPRALWGSLYEAAVAFPLARATLDLVLPKTLAFKVTPKGVVTDRRRFDVASSRLTLLAAAVTLGGILKGAFELAAFGIEVEAYAFNLAWAGAGLAGLLGALLVAWERPQRRADERLARRVRVVLEHGGLAAEAETVDLSTTGARVALPAGAALPPRLRVAFADAPGLRITARVAWREAARGGIEAGLAFEGAGAVERRALARLAYSADGALAGAHGARARTPLGMAWHFVAGLVRALRSGRGRRRLEARRLRPRLARWVGPGGARRVLLLDASAGGRGALFLGGAPAPGEALPLVERAGVRATRVAYARRLLPGLWRVGLAFPPGPLAPARPRAYVAA
ncbi:MAG: PilZ domain-containing protein [Anaeromyxobacteraceae bacterium]